MDNRSDADYREYLQSMKKESVVDAFKVLLFLLTMITFVGVILYMSIIH